MPSLILIIQLPAPYFVVSSCVFFSSLIRKLIQRTREFFSTRNHISQGSYTLSHSLLQYYFISHVHVISRFIIIIIEFPFYKGPLCLSYNRETPIRSLINTWITLNCWYTATHVSHNANNYNIIFEKNPQTSQKANIKVATI